MAAIWGTLKFPKKKGSGGAWKLGYPKFFLKKEIMRIKTFENSLKRKFVRGCQPWRGLRIFALALN